MYIRHYAGFFWPKYLLFYMNHKKLAQLGTANITNTSFFSFGTLTTFDFLSFFLSSATIGSNFSVNSKNWW